MKRSISLVLAVALVFCFCIIPVAAEGEPTATVTATLVGEAVPQAGDTFVISIDANNISSERFVAGQAQFAWPAEIATPVDSLDGSAITDPSNAYYAVAIENEFSGRSGKYDLSTAINMEKGTALIAITIAQKSSDQSAEIGPSKNICQMSFVLNEGCSYDDFYITFDTLTKLYLTEEGTLESNVANGAVSVEGITKTVSVGPIVVGDVTYDVVSENLITKGYDEFTVASDGTALPWEVVDNPEYTVSGGPSIHFVGAATGGTKENTMRTFFPITGGKTYYVTNTIYNNTGAVTAPQSTTGMRAVIATGDPVFGTFAGLTMYSHVNYGGINSWSNESDPTIIGDKVGRDDGVIEMGLSTVGYIINAPAEATNIMISYGAWSKNEIYYGDFAIYEVEASFVKEKAIVTFEYKMGEDVVKTVEIEGYVGETAEAPAVKFAKDGKLYAAEAASAEVVSGGSTEAVALSEVPNTVVASKTETFNATSGEVYPYPTASDRNAALIGTDAFISASWNDVRYGEIYLPLTVGEGEGINKATLTLTPGDVMNGWGNTFEIYAVDPATYGTADGKDAPEVVGEGTFTGVDVPTDIELDLTQYFNNYPAAEAVLLLYKVTDGMMGVYGASFEQAPYLTYEIGEAAAPTEPSTSEEPTSPSEEPSEEPTSEPEEPTSEPEEPTSEPEEPTSEPEEPTSEPEEPTIPEGAIVAVPGQNEAGIYALDEAIKTTATITFTVVPVAGANNTLVAINDSAQMTSSNYFGNSSVFFLFNGGKIATRDAGNTANEAVADFADGVAYTFVVEVDVENKTASYVISDENGVVAEGITPFRNANVEALDSIVLVNNDNVVDSLYVTDLVVDVPTEPTPELPFTDDGTKTITTPTGITVNAKFATETGANEGETVVVVTSFLKDGKPYMTVAQTATVTGGKIAASTQMNATDNAEYTVAAVSVLANTNPEAAITAENLGNPIGVLK